MKETVNLKSVAFRTKYYLWDQIDGEIPPGYYIPIGFLICFSWLVITSYANGQFVGPEAVAFWNNYTSDRSLLKKIFDVPKNDWGLYQARELSYLTDYLDAQIIYLSAKIGWLHFNSLVHCLCMFLIAFGSMLVSYRYLSTSIQGILIGLLFLTTPQAFISSFFRTAKCVPSLFFFVLMVWTWRRCSDFASAKWYSSASAFFRILYLLWATTLSLFDRLGAFLILASSVGFFIVGLLYRQKLLSRVGGQRRVSPIYDCALLLAAAYAFNSLYNHILGPALIRSVLGYQLERDYTFQFQVLPWKDFGLQQLIQGFSILKNQLSFFLGNLWDGSAIIGLILLILAFQLRRTRSTKFNPQAALLTLAFLGILAAFTVANAVMVLRQYTVALPDIQRHYYFIPLVTCFLMFFDYFFLSILPQKGNLNRFLTFFLIFCLLANIRALPGHVAVIRAGLANGAFKTSDKLWKSLRTNGSCDQFDLSTEYGKLCSALTKLSSSR